MKNHEECKSHIPPIKDVLDLIGSKWKVDIIIALSCDIHRFNELERQIEGISPRMLSKELKDLELNRLIQRDEISPFSNTFKYSLTEHGWSLREVFRAMLTWGIDYRNKVMVKTN